MYVIENFSQTAFDYESYLGGVCDDFFFLGGGGLLGILKLYLSLEALRNLTKPYKKPLLRVRNINITDFDNLAHGLP
jgi:hypothetical protein